jgi:hypothetical protein
MVSEPPQLDSGPDKNASAAIATALGARTNQSLMLAV